METITLNDGTIVNGHCLDMETALFIYLDDMDMLEGVRLFSDPEKTKIIVEENHGNTHTYEGYTKLSAVSSEFGNCNLVMRRGDNA